MDCAFFREQYSEFADGFLHESAEIAMLRHLTECESCKRLDAAYRAGSSALRQLPDLAVSPGFHERLQARILVAAAEAEPAARWQRWPAGALPLVALLSVVGWQFADHSVPSGRLTTPKFVVQFASDSATTYEGRMPMYSVLKDTSRDNQTSPEMFQVTVDYMTVP